MAKKKAVDPEPNLTITQSKVGAYNGMVYQFPTSKRALCIETDPGVYSHQFEAGATVCNCGKYEVSFI